MTAPEPDDAAPLPPSQWVTGAHPAAGIGSPGLPADAEGDLDTGTVPPVPAGANPPSVGTSPTWIEGPRPIWDGPTQLELGTGAAAPLPEAPPEEAAPDQDGGAQEVTLPPRSAGGAARPGPPREETLPPRAPPPRVAVEEITLPPAGAGARAAADPAPAVAPPVGSPPPRPPELTTYPPRHVTAGRRQRLLVLLLLLPPAAFVVGRLVRDRVLAPAVELRLTSPAPGDWSQDEVLVSGQTAGLVSGTAALEGLAEAPLGAQGQVLLRVRGLTEGVHDRTLVVRGQTARGTRAEARLALQLRVDRTPPALELLEPAEGAQLAAGMLALRLRVVERSDVTLSVRVDGAVSQVLAIPGGSGPSERRLALGPLAAGPHELRVEAMDRAGWTSTAQRRVRLGTTPPPVTPPPVTPPPVTPPPVTPPALPPSPPPRITISWSAGELLGPEGLGVQVEDATEVLVRLNGQVVARAAPWRLLPERVPDGVHRLEVWARGPGGEATEARQLRRDATPPELSLEVAARSSSPVTLEGRVHDAQDPAPRLLLSLDSGPPTPLPGLPARLELGPGEHTLRLLAMDTAGNRTERQATVLVEAPAPPPVTPPVTPPPVTPPPVTPPVTPPPVTPPVTPPPVTPPPLPADALLVRIPARARDAFRIELVDPHAVPPGTTAEVDCAGERLATGPLPLGCRLPAGRHLVSVVVRAPGAPARRHTGWVVIDQTRPVIANLRWEPIGPTRVRVTAEVRDAGPVTLALQLDGRPVAKALPAEVELQPGGHELTLIATDDVGNEARASQRLHVTAPTPVPPAAAPWPMDSRDPREAEAVALFERGRWAQAEELISEVLADGQGLRSPYVLRARMHMARAERLAKGDPRDRRLRAALEDVRVALLRYGDQAEARLHELHARILEELGRPQQAEEARAKARAAPR